MTGFMNFLRLETSSVATEYCFLVALIGVLAAASIATLGTAVKVSLYDKVVASLIGAN